MFALLDNNGLVIVKLLANILLKYISSGSDKGILISLGWKILFHLLI
jgi:hypothetical protein